MKDSNSSYEDADSIQDERPSRSQLKRDSAAAQKIGEELTALAPAVWKEFTLSNDLKAALLEYSRTPSNEGRRRQTQFIGRLMRTENVSVISKEIQEYKSGGTANTKKFHQLEDLRQQLLEGGEHEFENVVKLFPNLDKSELKQLVNNAKTKKDKTSARILFRYLKNLQDKS